MGFQDLLTAGRVLLRSPIFTLTAVLTIALGVGSSTAIFSVTNAVLLRPLPYRDPGRLVIASAELRQRDVHDLPLSDADFIDLREGTKAFFDDFAGVNTGPALVSQEDGMTEQIRWAVVTTNFFRMTGARILAGRDFNQEDGIPQPPTPLTGTNAEDTAAQPLPVMAILSSEYFQRRYGGDTNVLGRTMQTVGGPGLVIVGVLEPGFHLYFPPDANIESAPDVWIANRLDYDRAAFSMRAVGRLKDGVSLERAQAAADSVSTEAKRKFHLWDVSGFHLQIAPMRQHLIEAVRPAILALLGSAIFLLLIACANVANLMLVRASLRERELAMRAALGGSRWQQIRPLLSEAFLIAALGTLSSVALAWVGIRELRISAPASLPLVNTIRIDVPVLAFSALAGLITGVIFGLAPAWRISGRGLMGVLRAASQPHGLAGGRILRNTVVIAEVALSFVLLIGAGLMFRSFLAVHRVNPGFHPKHVLTFKILGVQALAKTPEHRSALIRQIKDHLGTIPGVQALTASYPFPLTGNFSPIRWGTEAALGDPSRFQATDFEIVLPGYFETMHTALLAGRTFTEDDNLPGRNNVIIDEFLASKAFPGQSPVGKRILIRVRTAEAEWVEVIGVVAHVRYTSLAEPGREQVYFTDAFMGSGRVRSWALRTDNIAASDSNQVIAAVRGVDPHLVVTEIEPAESLVSQAQAGTRFSLLLISIFAVIAGVLTGVGLYGVLATAVRQRTYEIGVRTALGATSGNIFQLVIGQGLCLSAAGIFAGLVTSFFVTRVMSAMLVRVKPTDPVTFAGMTVVFLAISALASWLPARRAAGVNPAKALREP